MTNENNQAENMPQEAAELSYEETGEMGALWAALAKAQGEFQPINKTREVEYAGRKFGYAELDEVFRKTRPALSANGLCLIQPFHGLTPGKVMTTKLCHASGSSLTIRVRVPEAADIQKLGSALTYLRRYSVSCLLGVASEDDDDGNAAVDSPKQTADRSKPPPARPAAQPTSAPKPAEQPKPPVKAEASPGVHVAPQKIQEATVLEITTLARSLGFSRPQMAEFCMKVLGKVWDKADPSTEPTEEEGLKLLGQLKEAKASVA